MHYRNICCALRCGVVVYGVGPRVYVGRGTGSSGEEAAERQQRVGFGGAQEFRRQTEADRDSMDSGCSQAMRLAGIFAVPWHMAGHS